MFAKAITKRLRRCIILNHSVQSMNLTHFQQSYSNVSFLAVSVTGEKCCLLCGSFNGVHKSCTKSRLLQLVYSRDRCTTWRADHVLQLCRMLTRLQHQLRRSLTDRHHRDTNGNNQQEHHYTDTIEIPIMTINKNTTTSHTLKYYNR